MHLYLVRHGQSMGNVDQGYIAGRSDKKGLTPKGKSQIVRTAWELKNIPFKTIYSSPVVRAKESATILHNLLNVPLKTLEFIQEMSYGDYEGEYFWINLEKKMKDFEGFNKKIDHAFPNGESMQMISDRIWEGWNKWLSTIDTDEKANIMFVSHDAIISSLLFILMYGHPSHKDATVSYKNAYMNFVHNVDVPNGSIYVIDLHAKPVKFHLMKPDTKEMIPTEETLGFYAKGMLDIHKPKITEKITASENKVFHISNSTNAIIKLLHEREIVSSERIVSIYKYLKEKTSILAPEALIYDKGGAFFKETVLVQDYAEGQDQNEILKKHECKMEILELTNNLLKQIHQINCEDVEAFWYPDDEWHKVHVPWHIYMTDEIDDKLGSLAKSVPDTAARNKVRMVLRRLREYINKQQTELVAIHGDFAPQNIVVTKDGKLRCLDFERARIGDAMWDYAYYYGWLQRKDKKTAYMWYEIVKAQLTPQEFEYFEFYTVLFHTWTICDIFEYKKNSLRAQRGEKSREILYAWAGVK